MTEFHIYSTVVQKMEMQRMIEMLAKMNTKMDTNQEKVDAIHKEIMTKIDDSQKRMEADRKTDRGDMKREIRAGPETHERDDQNQSREDGGRCTIHTVREG
jgi:hypothetical protein